MRVLSLIHQDDAPTGTFADAVRERGGELIEWNLVHGAPPEPPEAFDAVLVFGGGMHVDQEEQHPWLREEDDLIKSLLDAGPATQEEVGWHEVELTPEAAGDPLFAAAPERFDAFQWHSYAFDLPPGGVPLARNPVGLQAFRIGDSAWGIQFHAEVTREIVEGWLASDRTGRQIELAPMERWARVGRALADRFLDVAARRPRRERPAATRAS